MNEMRKCPNCGADDWDIGALYPRGTVRRVTYKPDSKGIFAIKDDVEVKACNKCGYIELYRLSMSQSIQKAYDQKPLSQETDNSKDEQENA